VLLGEIKYHNIEPSFDQLNKIKALPLRQQLANFSFGGLIRIEPLSNGHFIIAYQTLDKNAHLLIISREGSVIVSQNQGLITSPNFYWLDEITLMKINQTIVVHLAYYFYDGTKTCELKSFNSSNLNLKKEIHLKHQANLFASYEANLFNLSNQSGTNYMLTYDSKLNCKLLAGQSNCVLPHFYSPNCTRLQVNEKFYFLLVNKEIKIMDRLNGLFLREFKLIANNFLTYADRYILSFEREKKRLSTYNFNGQLLNEDTIVKLSDDTELVSTSNKELVFFDRSQISLHF
jgi:hypothetical protein